MTTAHIFYIPVILFVGVLAGFFLGRQASERDLERRRKRAARRKAVAEKRRKQAAGATTSEHP